VNSNSLHQLYRDRLGSAFLIRRRVFGQRIEEEVDLDDGFCLTDIKPEQAPYQLINTACPEDSYWHCRHLVAARRCGFRHQVRCTSDAWAAINSTVAPPSPPWCSRRNPARGQTELSQQPLRFFLR